VCVLWLQFSKCYNYQIRRNDDGDNNDDDDEDDDDDDDDDNDDDDDDDDDDSEEEGDFRPSSLPTQQMHTDVEVCLFY